MSTEAISVEDVAARYVARLLSGLCTDDERRGITAWLDAAPAHWCAFQRARRAWSALELIEDLGADRGPDTRP